MPSREYNAWGAAISIHQTNNFQAKYLCFHQCKFMSDRMYCQSFCFHPSTDNTYSQIDSVSVTMCSNDGELAQHSFGILNSDIKNVNVSFTTLGYTGSGGRIGCEVGGKAATCSYIQVLNGTSKDDQKSCIIMSRVSNEGSECRCDHGIIMNCQSINAFGSWEGVTSYSHFSMARNVITNLGYISSKGQVKLDDIILDKEIVLGSATLAHPSAIASSEKYSPTLISGLINDRECIFTKELKNAITRVKRGLLIHYWLCDYRR